MVKKPTQNRRDFIKTTVSGSAGLLLADGISNNVLAKDSPDQILEINPKVNNLRVVYVQDPAMLSEGLSTGFGGFKTSTSKIKADVVKKNLDKMACALTNQSDTKKAWETLFQKPNNKEWSNIKIAIKPNCAAQCADRVPHASIPIMKVICDVLVGFGVKGPNITVYDVSPYSGDPSKLYSASSLVSGIKIAGPGSGTYNTTPYKAATAIKDVDIIVNIASNKGHAQLGKTTLCMKNHIGSMKLNCPSGVSDIVKINKSEAILGNPNATTPPKQQIAIVDSLWSAKSGPSAGPDKTMAMIVMGTFCASVDCFTAIKVRLEKCQYPGTRSTYISYLTSYGYSSSEIEPLLKNPSPSPDEKGRGWIDALKWNPTSIQVQNTTPYTSAIEFILAGKGVQKTSIAMNFNRTEKIKNINIYNVKGSLIKTIVIPQTFKSTQALVWDGTNNSKKPVPAGLYIVTIHGEKTLSSDKISLKR